MRLVRWLVVLLIAVLALAEGVWMMEAHAATMPREIFCKVGFHRVLRDGQFVCVRNSPVQSHPLDCIHWRILNNGGTGPLVRELICSAIPKGPALFRPIGGSARTG